MSGRPPEKSPPTGALERALSVLNQAILRAAQIALIVACCVLSYSVAARYFFKWPTYWQDEFSVFLLVGATFLSAAYVQAERGHVGIEAIVGLLPPPVERARRLLVDGLSLAFCLFFSWKSWTLAHEAFADGQVTSSTWAPPLFIPYATMALGMSLLSLQILAQIVAALRGRTAKELVR